MPQHLAPESMPNPTLEPIPNPQTPKPTATRAYPTRESKPHPANLISMLAQNLARITQQVNAASHAYARAQNLPAHHVQIIAVSKYQSLESIHALYQAGQHAFGENKVQDLRTKAQAPQSIQTPHNQPEITWHFIGTLQRNKINTLLALSPALIHSIDSIELALALDERCKKLGRIQRVLLQVNSANEPSKHGFSPESTLDTFARISSQAHNLQICGLMTIGAHTQELTRIQESFQKTKELYDCMKAQSPHIDTLSMGMSGDFTHAIMQGANMVRIGSALFTTHEQA